ncbi:hypothetical protein [Ammoniphilus sp. 3BR4]|uniref:hypothetical protein n=1 Tax=Ammoniphilus sp. 3BR4 TaxID=3158265 RepID=UPI003465B669
MEFKVDKLEEKVEYLQSKGVKVNDYFYHYRFHDQNTSAHHQKELNQVKKYLYEKYLKEWGNEYQPLYYISDNGWLDIKEIVPTKNRSYVDL